MGVGGRAVYVVMLGFSLGGGGESDVSVILEGGGD